MFALAVEPDTPHHVGWASATTADAAPAAVAVARTTHNHLCENLDRARQLLRDLLALLLLSVQRERAAASHRLCSPHVNHRQAHAAFAPLPLLLALLHDTQLHQPQHGVALCLGIGAAKLEHEGEARAVLLGDARFDPVAAEHSTTGRFRRVRSLLDLVQRDCEHLALIARHPLQHCSEDFQRARLTAEGHTADFVQHAVARGLRCGRHRRRRACFLCGRRCPRAPGRRSGRRSLGRR